MTKCIAVMVALVGFAIGAYTPTATADSPGSSPQRTVVLYNSTVPTNGASATTATTATRQSGYIDGFYLDVGGTAGQTSVVSIVTTATYGDIQVARTLYSNTAYTSADDGYIPVRVQAKSTAGAAISGVYCPMTLFQETVTISVSCHASSVPGTGVTFKAVMALAP